MQKRNLSHWYNPQILKEPAATNAAASAGTTTMSLTRLWGDSWTTLDRVWGDQVTWERCWDDVSESRGGIRTRQDKLRPCASILQMIDPKITDYKIHHLREALLTFVGAAKLMFLLVRSPVRKIVDICEG